MFYAKVSVKGPVAYVIDMDDDRHVLQCYDRVIAVKDHDRVLLDENYWKFSTTTSKYRNAFLGEDLKATEKKVQAGSYRLVDLNDF